MRKWMPKNEPILSDPPRMGPRVRDITGNKYNKLRVISYQGLSKWGGGKWACVCECGNVGVYLTHELTSLKSKSCGCHKIKINTRHGQRNTRLYRIWTSMKSRCANPNSKAYRYYGGKGVKVCQEWLEFKPFFEWASAAGYSDELTIDRIDADGDYCPENCQWITQRENTRRKDSLTLCADEASLIRTYLAYKSKNQQELSKMFGVSPTLISQIKTGDAWADVGCIAH